MVRFIYSLVMYLLIPFIILRLWWKGKHLPAYRQRILERFCLNKKIAQTQIDIWIHAVSLGEVIAATPLIDLLLNRNWAILVTTMTPTGSEYLGQHFSEKLTHQYVPYDLPLVLKRFLKRYKPRLVVIMETEIWPNLIHQTSLAQIPIILANARLSARSLKGYQLLKFFFKPLLNQLSAILSQSAEDATRFISLGAQKELLQVFGNMKFDLTLNTINKKKLLFLKEQWGPERLVVIAASTHEDEELQILLQLKQLQQASHGVLLLIAPRHPERFHHVFQLALRLGFKTGLRTLNDSISDDTEVIILDCLGELLGFYQLSNFAFIGGSLAPVGGHNILEPIALKVPVFIGPHFHNFKSICDELIEKQAITIVQKANELVDAIMELFHNEKLCKQRINNASLVFNSNRGSVQKHLYKIEALLN